MIITVYDRNGKAYKSYGEIEIFLDDEEKEELDEYCKRNKYRYELHDTYIILKKLRKNSKKRENEQPKYISGEWVDCNGNVLEKVDKAISNEGFVVFDSKRNNKVTYILKDFFNIKKEK